MIVETQLSEQQRQDGAGEDSRQAAEAARQNEDDGIVFESLMRQLL